MNLDRTQRRVVCAAIRAADGEVLLGVRHYSADMHRQIEARRDGEKTKEYRLCTPYWRRRLEMRSYDRIVLTKGYPPRDDHSRRLTREWRGYTIEKITHPHFGPEPVKVFAIVVNEGAASDRGGETAC